MKDGAVAAAASARDPLGQKVATGLQLHADMAHRVRAMMHKIWDDRQRPATDALNRVYLGRLDDVPRVGSRLNLLIDRRGEPEPIYLTTAPVERILGDPSRGLLFVDTGQSIYRVSIGPPHVAALGQLGRRADDRRSFARMWVRTPLIVEASGGRQVGLTEDLCAGGVLFRAPEELEVGERVELSFDLHGSLGIRTRATGVVVRSTRGGRKESSTAAVAFDQPWSVD